MLYRFAAQRVRFFSRFGHTYCGIDFGHGGHKVAINGVWFFHCSLDYDVLLEKNKALFSSVILSKKYSAGPSQIMFTGILH